MAELVNELEPMTVIDQESKDPNAGEKKRKMISQNGNLSFRSFFTVSIVGVLSSFLLKQCLVSVFCWCVVSLSVYTCKCLDHVENVPCQGHQLSHHLLRRLHLQLRGQHRVCGGADPASTGQFSQLTWKTLILNYKRLCLSVSVCVCLYECHIISSNQN